MPTVKYQKERVKHTVRNMGYNGKDAYPNYIAHVAIEGFEEYQCCPARKLKCLRELYDTSSAVKLNKF
jgi:hypothetical protein